VFCGWFPGEENWCKVAYRWAGDDTGHHR
jgi:hypothetical protein